jgi:regulator of cell morphogenesis and NO signaling
VEGIGKKERPMTDTTTTTTTTSTTTIDPRRTLGDLVAESPARGVVFDRFKLDYCCHGQRSLAAACASDGVDLTALLDALDAVPASASVVEHPSEPAALADHIEATHHAYLHQELPELRALAAKVRDVHVGRHAELAQVSALVDELVADLEPHLLKEERVLFPAIRQMAAGPEHDRPFGTVANPIRMMVLEHDRAGELLAQLRDVSAEYAVPDDACGSYRSLYGRLAHLEADTHRHIHLENNVLFPAAIALEGA